MSDTSTSSSGGVSLFTVVGIVFIILKLVGVITWSWWLVLIPFYPAALIILLIIIGIIIVAVKA